MSDPLPYTQIQKIKNCQTMRTNSCPGICARRIFPCQALNIPTMQPGNFPTLNSIGSSRHGAIRPNSTLFLNPDAVMAPNLTKSHQIQPHSCKFVKFLSDVHLARIMTLKLRTFSTFLHAQVTRSHVQSHLTFVKGPPLLMVSLPPGFLIKSASGLPITIALPAFFGYTQENEPDSMKNC